MGAGNSQLSLNISVHSAHFSCQNVRTSIYEVRRKSLCFRGFPPNSLSFKFRRLLFHGFLRRSFWNLKISEFAVCPKQYQIIHFSFLLSRSTSGRQRPLRMPLPMS